MAKKPDTKSGRKVAEATEEVTRMVKAGANLKDAACKVAEGKQLNKGQIERMAESYNQSHGWELGMQSKGGQKVASYSLLDPDAVKAVVFPGQKKAEAPQVVFPDKPVAAISLADLSQKAAGADAPTEKQNTDVRHWFSSCATLRTLAQKAASAAEEQASILHQAVGNMVQKLAQHVDRLDDKGRHTYARLVVNNYQELGTDLLNWVGSAMQRGELAIPQKTAEHAVFPANELYSLTVDAINQSFKFSDMADELLYRQKVAGVFDSALGATEDVLGKADTLMGMGDSAEKVNEKQRYEEAFSPEFYNQLREIDALGTFMDVVNQPEMRKYSMNDQRKAYNTVVQLTPAAAKNPAVLRILMKQTLTTGTDPDLFSTGQMVNLNEALSKPLAEREKLEMDKRTMALKERETKAREDMNKIPRGGYKPESAGLLSGLLANIKAGPAPVKDDGEAPKVEPPPGADQLLFAMGNNGSPVRLSPQAFAEAVAVANKTGKTQYSTYSPNELRDMSNRLATHGLDGLTAQEKDYIATIVPAARTLAANEALTTAGALPIYSIPDLGGGKKKGTP